MKKKPYNLAIVIGFLALYLFAMVLSTYIMTNNYREMHKNNIDTIVNDINSALYYWDAFSIPESGDQEKQFSNYLTTLISRSDVFRNPENEYQHISVALYEPSGNKCAQTSAYFQVYNMNDEAENPHTLYCYPVNDYLPKDAQKELGKYYAKHFKSDAYWSVHLSLIPETNEPVSVDVRAMYVKKQINPYTPASTSFSWQDDTQTVENTLNIGSQRWVYEVVYPYAASGYDEYQKWLEDDFIQDFTEPSGGHAPEQNGTVWKQQNTYVDNIRHLNYYYVIRETARPLLGALNYLKFVYLIALIFTIVCIIVILRITNKVYAKRVALEETRRDFTNAIAHELKTPLGIIRGFAENLQEGTVVGKKDYYIKQMINQTENMDDMVQEMLYISKLDSEQLKLKKEPLSLLSVIEEQLQKLEPLTDEKNLDIRYEVAEDFIINSDKLYLEKAVWNLLSNAIDYNRPDGIITISTSAQMCSIENTGSQITDDDLVHVFDMFFTSNKARNSKEKHLGLGLYLAKRILDLHDLKLSIENTDFGVKVTIRK